MTGNNIRFICASDRINYGDLLFPIIFKKYLEKLDCKIKFHNYGIIKSDLSSFGALKTNSFKKLENDLKSGDKLVVGGGEVFFASWQTIYSFVNPLYRKLSKKSFFKRLDNKFEISKRILTKNKVKLPFCYNPQEFNLISLKIYYNSVGGGRLLNETKISKHIKECLELASLVSLRDNRSMSYFDMQVTIKNCLVPDSALMMSIFFDESMLKVKKSIIDFDFKYIYVQIGINKGPKDLNLLINNLKVIAKSKRAKIILCPIGLAPGHEDHIILKKIHSLDKHFIYIQPKNIYDIMYLILKSSLYIGTSLHGAITAMSFNVPFVGLNKKITKLESYAQTWIHSDYENIDFENLSMNNVNKLVALFQTHYSRAKFNDQIRCIEKNLNFIINE